MHVECTPENASDVRLALVGVDAAANGLDVDVRDVTPVERSTPTFAGQLSLTGVDRPGLLYALSDVLSAQGLNIDHLQTEQHLMPAGDMPPLFTTQCHVCGTTSPDLDALRKELKQLEADLGVRCSLKVLNDAGR
jgi:glycine cleavage system regulatory protein